METKPNRIEAQAAEWVALHDAGLVPDQERELNLWLAADARHHGAYVRAQAMWHDVDRLAALGAGMERAPTGAHARLRKAFASTRGYLLAASAVIALCAVVLFYREILFFGTKTYASEIGEIRNIQLVDGSQLTLNTDTRATVRYRDDEREIALTRGEALFKVAHDATRPFIVRANHVVVRAVGTAFTVRVDDTRTDVIVAEGTVEVSRVDAAGVKTIQRVTANHRVMLASAASRPDIEPVPPDAMNRELAWRDGMAAFAGEPLSVAVAEINRHSRHRIYIDDPVLASRPVIGIFHANDAEGFATAVAATFGAQLEHTNEEIHLRVGANRR